MFWWIPAGLAARLPLQPVPAAAVVGAPASVSVAHDGTVWIAGDRGVVRLGGAPRSWEVDSRAGGVPRRPRRRVGGGPAAAWCSSGTTGPSPVAGATGEGYHLPVGPGGDCWVTPQDGVAGPLRRGDGGAGVLPVAVPAGVEVVALARDGGGRWWLGSSDGLYELQSDAVREVPGTRGSKAFPLRPQGDVMWVGTGDGVLRVRGDDVSRPLAGQYVTGGGRHARGHVRGAPPRARSCAWAPTARGRWWSARGPRRRCSTWRSGPAVGCGGPPGAGGLVRYADADRTLEVFDRGDGLPSGVVQDLAIDREGTLWITTELGVTRLAHYRPSSGGASPSSAATRSGRSSPRVPRCGRARRRASRGSAPTARGRGAGPAGLVAGPRRRRPLVVGRPRARRRPHRVGRGRTARADGAVGRDRPGVWC
jgi:hypothetical protein